MAEYYIHSTGEILLLLFIFSLWFTSVYYWFKRYKKITTIERAELPRNDKQSEIENKNSTHTSHSSLNLKARVKDVPSSETLQFNANFNNAFSNAPNLLMSNYSLCTMLNTNNFRQLNHGSSRLSQLRGAASLDKSSSRTSLFRNSQQRQPACFIKYECSSRSKLIRPRYLNNKRIANILSFSNYDVSNLFKNSSRHVNPTPAVVLTKTVSEPLGICQDLNNQSKNNSSNENLVELPKFVSKKVQVPKRDSDLLDPNLIPPLVRRSFIDLHKKSMTNLSNAPKTSTGAVYSGSNNLKTNVYTQQRSSNEVVMNVKQNYLTIV